MNALRERGKIGWLTLNSDESRRMPTPQRIGHSTRVLSRIFRIRLGNHQRADAISVILLIIGTRLDLHVIPKPLDRDRLIRRRRIRNHTLQHHPMPLADVLRVQRLRKMRRHRPTTTNRLRWRTATQPQCRSLRLRGRRRFRRGQRGGEEFLADTALAEKLIGLENHQLRDTDALPGRIHRADLVMAHIGREGFRDRQLVEVAALGDLKVGAVVDGRVLAVPLHRGRRHTGHPGLKHHPLARAHALGAEFERKSGRSRVSTASTGGYVWRRHCREEISEKKNVYVKIHRERTEEKMGVQGTHRGENGCTGNAPRKKCMYRERTEEKMGVYRECINVQRIRTRKVFSSSARSGERWGRFGFENWHIWRKTGEDARTVTNPLCILEGGGPFLKRKMTRLFW